MSTDTEVIAALVAQFADRVDDAAGCIELEHLSNSGMVGITLFKKVDKTPNQARMEAEQMLKDIRAQLAAAVADKQALAASVKQLQTSVTEAQQSANFLRNDIAANIAKIGVIEAQLRAANTKLVRYETALPLIEVLLERLSARCGHAEGCQANPAGGWTCTAQCRKSMADQLSQAVHSLD